MTVATDAMRLVRITPAGRAPAVRCPRVARPGIPRPRVAGPGIARPGVSGPRIAVPCAARPGIAGQAQGSPRDAVEVCAEDVSLSAELDAAVRDVHAPACELERP